MPSDDLHLNSVSRFSKKSPRLHLEVHGHCEVPAGCGGVVLRWYNPEHALPVLIRQHVVARKCELTIDGEAPATARPMLRPGDHVLGLVVHEPPPDHGFLMLALALDRDATYAMKDPFLARSAADGTWLFTTDAPTDEAWTRVDFVAAAGWRPMAERPLPEPERRTWTLDRVRETGSRPMGLPTGEHAPTVWVRKVFTVRKEPS